MSNQFTLTEAEKREVDIIAEFVVVYYAKPFLQSPIAASAPINDLQLMVNINNYMAHRPVVANSRLQSCHRHMWYLTPQLVVLSLVDENTSDNQKEEVALQLWKTPRPGTFKRKCILNFILLYEVIQHY